MASTEAGEEAYKNMKDIHVEKYHITLRPHASELALFAPGMKPNVTEEAVI